MTLDKRRAKIAKLAEKYEGATLDVNADDTPVLTVPGDGLLKVAKELRKAGFDLLHTVTGIDYLDHLQVVYHLFSTQDQGAVVLKAILPRDGGSVASVVPVWVTADWHERETAELLGVEFKGHPDPRRLLLAEDFPGYPLRRDWYCRDLEEYLLK